MKFPLNDLTCIYSGKGQTVINTRESSNVFRTVMLIITVIALAACSRPQQASSSLDDSARGASTSDTNLTPTSSGSAGEAVLNLERSVMYFYSTGSDSQREVGAIPLQFSTTTELGDLIVEGAGKTIWTENADFPACKFTGKAEGKVTVTGLFSVEDCMFHLTIATKFSQPTVSNQSGSCTGSIVFSETEFSSQIELDPESTRFKETKKDGWWEVTTVKLSDLKSNAVDLCFTADVLK
jgi:hypothetical protein